MTRYFDAATPMFPMPWPHHLGFITACAISVLVALTGDAGELLEPETLCTLPGITRSQHPRLCGMINVTLGE
ncbi:MAG: hypothetical protein EON55_13320 [Alphaproteobacteria bacterium]|nr:MAG: hypothetical protein EON55_13320 [Alphaproteobacteria bacterium]